MSRTTYDQWTCDGCGAICTVTPTRQPEGWARFDIGRPPLTAEPHPLGSFCETCTQRILDTHFRYFEHGERPDPQVSP